MFGFIKKFDKRSRFILFVCYFSFFCNGILALMIGSALPDIKSTYGISDTVSGLFLSAHSIGNMVAGFAASVLPLYLGERKSIMALSAMAFIGFLMMLIWGNPVWLFVAFVMTGFGRGSVTNFDNRMVNMISEGSSTASNCLHAAFAVGAVLAPMIFLAMSRLISWRAALVAVVLFGCFSIFNLSRIKLEHEYPDRKDNVNKTLIFMKNPSYLILVAMMFFYLCSEYSINGWLVTYIQNKEGLLALFDYSDEAVIAYSQSMATLFWIVMLVGRLSCAALSLRFHQKKLLMICSFGVMGFFLMMLNSSSIPMVTVSVAGLGLCMAGMSPMIYADAAVFSNVYPMAVSCLIVIGSLGSVMMNTVIGILADHFGFQGGMSAITVAVVFLVIFSVLNAVVKTRDPAKLAVS